MPPQPLPPPLSGSLLTQPVTARDQQIEQLQEQLAEAQDARREDRFVFIVTAVILLDIVFFSVMPSFGGPLALVLLELLVLIPLARRMGMEEIAQAINRVLERWAGKAGDGK